MMCAMSAPVEVPLVAASHERLITWLDGLDPVDPGRPSELPDWTVGHVMTHLARNADSFTAMLAAAAQGRSRKQYPGGRAERSADIEAGATRGWNDLVHDVTEASNRLDATMSSTTDDAWAATGGDPDFAAELAGLPQRRMREVEIHRLDLGLGATWREWTDDFVSSEWPNSMARLGERLPPGVVVELEVDDEGGVSGTEQRVGIGDTVIRLGATRTELLAWMTGRHMLDGAPALTSWP